MKNYRVHPTRLVDFHTGRRRRAGTGVALVQQVHHACLSKICRRRIFKTAGATGGYVDLAALAAFPNLAAMGADVASLARVLKHSRLVELDPTGTLVLAPAARERGHVPRTSKSNRTTLSNPVADNPAPPHYGTGPRVITNTKRPRDDRAGLDRVRARSRRCAFSVAPVGSSSMRSAERRSPLAEARLLDVLGPPLSLFHDALGVRAASRD